ncbi:hypothetical protein DIPPA_25840 [Diplonema papillatum]|nr:hypothetical protein DIPPA_25840 [Diplonema papillatum]
MELVVEDVGVGETFATADEACKKIKLAAGKEGKTLAQQCRNEAGIIYRCVHMLQNASGEEVSCAFYVSVRNQQGGSWKCVEAHEHTCQTVGQACTKGMAKVVANEMRQLISEKKVTASIVASAFRSKFDIQVSNKIARVAIQQVEDDLFGTVDEAYAQVADFLQHLKEKNPGTDAYVHRTSDGRFHHAYLALSCCKEAFRMLQPSLLSADGAFLKGEMRGHLLALVAVDPASRVLPLAVAVFPDMHEGNEGWRSFIQSVRRSFDLDGKSLMTDRRTGLDRVIAEEVPAGGGGLDAPAQAAVNVARNPPQAPAAFDAPDFDEPHPSHHTDLSACLDDPFLIPPTQPSSICL